MKGQTQLEERKETLQQIKLLYIEHDYDKATFLNVIDNRIEELEYILEIEDTVKKTALIKEEKPKQEKTKKFPSNKLDIDIENIFKEITEGKSLPKISEEVNINYNTLFGKLAQWLYDNDLETSLKKLQGNKKYYTKFKERGKKKETPIKEEDKKLNDCGMCNKPAEQGFICNECEEKSKGNKPRPCPGCYVLTRNKSLCDECL